MEERGRTLGLIIGEVAVELSRKNDGHGDDAPHLHRWKTKNDPICESKPANACVDELKGPD